MSVATLLLPGLTSQCRSRRRTASCNTPLNDFRAGGILRGCSHSIIFRLPSLLATQIVLTAGLQCGCQGGRGVYIRAERSSLPPRASDMLAVRIGQLTAEVFHLLDLQPCWLLRTSHSVNRAHLLASTLLARCRRLPRERFRSLTHSRHRAPRRSAMQQLL
jgi:hypothetical protein